MKNLENYIQYFPISSGNVSDEFEREFTLHKDIISEVYFYLDGFPKVNTVYTQKSFSDIELLSYIQTPYISYVVHSINSRDTLFYPVDDILYELARKYSKEHLESILPNSNYIIANFPNDFKFKENGLYVSKKLIKTICYKFSFEEKMQETDDVIDFFTNLSYLQEDTDDVLDRMYL